MIVPTAEETGGPKLPPAAPTTGGPAADDRRPHDRNQHMPILIVASLIVLLSLMLKVRDDQRVEVIGISGLPVPETCGMRLLFHCDCPGCGLTRSFVHLAHGNLWQSLQVHRLGWLVALFVLVQFPYRWYLMRYPLPQLQKTLATVFGVVLIGALFLNWFCKLWVG